MSDEIRAYTKMDPTYPGYVNIKKADDGSVVLTVRGDPTTNEDGYFICGYPKDKGHHGRCTPGDEHCNNYCNLAPEKGKMQDHPKACVRVHVGPTAVITLTADEFVKAFGGEVD